MPKIVTGILDLGFGIIIWDFRKSCLLKSIKKIKGEPFGDKENFSKNSRKDLK